MKRLFFSLLLTLIALCPLTACGQKAAPATTWQEQYDLGIRYLSEGNYEEAIIAFTAAIEIDPKRPEPYLSLADAYIAAGDPEAAWKALEDGLAATEDPNIQTRLDNWASGGTDSPSQQLQPGYPRTEEGDYGDGRRYVNEYDAYGNIVKNTQYDTGGALLNWTEYSYDAAGQQTAEVLYHADGSESYRLSWEYNAAGICVRQTYTHSDRHVDVDEFDDSGKHLRHLLYHEDGWLYSLTEYGDNGEIVRDVCYNPDGTERDDAY